MTDIIHDEGGTIDKYEGDAIIAFWNAPLDIPDHAVKAVRAALRCQETLAKMRSAFMESVGVELYMRIGINTGPAVVGNLGSHERFDYTIIGDAVNLAARLEGANKQFGTYTMISHDSKILLKEQVATREIARLTVVGRKEPVRVYEPMTREDFKSKKNFLKKFNVGLEYFYKGQMVKGIEIFDKIRMHDPAAAAYAEKCRVLMSRDLKDWKGVWRMTSK
jgi:adenylate cyclase